MSSADLVSSAAEPALRVFLGYGSREDMAYRVCRRSLKRRSSIPLEITPIVQQELRDAGLYRRERGPTESTEVSFTRFLTPYLPGYRGWALFTADVAALELLAADANPRHAALFVDCNFLSVADVAALGRLAADADPRHAALFVDCDFLSADVVPALGRLAADADPRHAVLCVHHDYTPTELETGATKKDGAVQTAYPCKNWSAMLLFDCGHSKNRDALTPQAVSTRCGPFVHLDYTPTEATKMDGAVQTADPCKNWPSMLVVFNCGHSMNRAALALEAYLHRFTWLDDDDVGEVPFVWNFLVGYNRVNSAHDAGTAPRAIHSVSHLACKALA